jgi:hypothetical protein
VSLSRTNHKTLASRKRSADKEMGKGKERGKGKDKGKAIPLQGLVGHEVSSRLRLPDFKTIGT